jgi:hypothetical protein
VRGVGLDGAGGSTAQPLLGGRLPGRPTDRGTGPSKGPTRKRCEPEGSQRSRAGCPFKTEQKDRTFGWARSEETAPSTAVRPGVRVVSGQLGAPWNETPKGSR